MAPFLLMALTGFSVRSHAYTHKLQRFYAYRIECFRGAGDKMQGFHISATILLILAMKRHYSLKAVCQKWIGCLIPGHWTTASQKCLGTEDWKGWLLRSSWTVKSSSPHHSQPCIRNFLQKSLQHRLHAYLTYKTPMKFWDRMKTP